MRRSAAHVLALFGYLVGSLLATWPLAAHFATHVTGDGIDDPALAWNLWWIKYRLVDQLQPDIFHTGWLFHPIQINLGFYTLTPLNGLLSVPLQTATTLSIANNVLMLSSFVLSGYGVWLLVQTVWARHFNRVSRMDHWLAWGVAWLAGAFYAFASAKLFYASLGQFNIVSSHWIPFCALYVWRTLHSDTRREAWRNGSLAGLFLVFQAWAELTYATFLLLFFALAYLYFSVTWLTSKRREMARWLRGTQGMVAAALLFTVGISPFLAAILPDMAIEGDFFASGGGFADTYSADLMGYFMPTRLHPALGAWVETLPFSNDKGQHIYLGYTLMLLIVMGVLSGLRSQSKRVTVTTGFWLLAIGGFWLLTLGPLVRWAGENLAIPGPFALISQLPFFNGNRYPSRYSVMLLLCAALLAANGLLWLTTRLSGKRWGKLGNKQQQESRHPDSLAQARLPSIVLILIGLLFSAEHLSTPLPLSDLRIPPVYQRLAAEPGDFAVLELPTGWRNGARVLGKSDVLIMMQQWYQTEHGKRRLGGNTSRNPAYKFQYFSETPLLADLIALMNSDRSHLEPVLEEEYLAIAARIRKSAPELLALLDVRYVTLHVEQSPALLLRLVEEALPVTLIEEWQGSDWMGAPSTIRLYSVNASPTPNTLAVDFAVPDANMYLAEGWSPIGDSDPGRFATRARVDLLLPAWSSGAQVTLTFAQASTVRYSYHGYSLGQQSGNVHTIDLPSLFEHVPTPRLTLAFDGAPTPVTALVPNATPIGNTGASLAPGLAILAQSAGEEVGDFAHIWINGVDYAYNERGYNLVAMSPGGEVLGRGLFDTFDVSKPGESERMAAWLKGWERGTVIIGAGADSVAREDGNTLKESAIVALEGVGVAGDLRGKFRWSHVFVGVVGAPPGHALEEIQLTRPASVWLGVPLPAASGYGPLQSLTLERLPQQ